jgi:hypothetical protein
MEHISRQVGASLPPLPGRVAPSGRRPGTLGTELVFGPVS